VIAEFQPADALGKVHPGQHATLRLQGFPWAQFGTVPAEVSRVAGDIRDGKVRVELAVNPVAGSRIPLQHGLPGSVEVEVERISPLALVLRSAGQVLGSR
jgi:membrane fusion protein (multidrug efflux system)